MVGETNVGVGAGVSRDDGGADGEGDAPADGLPTPTGGVAPIAGLPDADAPAVGVTFNGPAQLATSAVARTVAAVRTARSRAVLRS